MEKRYYWLKLKKNYFSRLDQRKMKKQKNGKDMQLIYLNMMLLSVDTGGYIYYQGVYDSIEEELAEEFLEDAELVKQTIAYLSENNLLEINEEKYFLPQVAECTGSESASAGRVRKHRKALQCNEEKQNVTECNIDIEKESELDIEKEIEKKHTKENTKEKFVAPQLCEVEKYLSLRNVTSFTANEFVDYYATRGWKTNYGIPIVDWKACINTWISRKEESKTDEPREKTRFDYLESDFINNLEEAGAITEDGGLNFGILQDHDGWIDKVREADEKADSYNRKHGVREDERWQ